MCVFACMCVLFMCVVCVRARESVCFDLCSCLFVVIHFRLHKSLYIYDNAADENASLYVC